VCVDLPEVPGRVTSEGASASKKVEREDCLLLHFNPIKIRPYSNSTDAITWKGKTYLTHETSCTTVASKGAWKEMAGRGTKRRDEDELGLQRAGEHRIQRPGQIPEEDDDA
jgi:hypothetical protein